jgi:hypothetical protein
MFDPKNTVYLWVMLFHMVVIIFVLKIVKIITDYKNVAKDYLD